LAIKQAHLLAADVSFLEERGAHLVRRQNAKQINWRPFRWRQIFSLVPRFQKSGHAGMDWLYVELKICVKSAKVGVLVWLYSQTRTQRERPCQTVFRMLLSAEIWFRPLTQPNTCQHRGLILI
jgi:hypothetical protein